MADEYVRKQDAVEAVAFGITIASAFNRETGERIDLFVNENEELQKAIERIKGLSSADVAPVRHGRWIKVGVWGRVYKCNQCGNFLDFDGVNAGRGDANFCPNCDAKMDEKEGQR